jgi:hypothetical protein
MSTRLSPLQDYPLLENSTTDVSHKYLYLFIFASSVFSFLRDQQCNVPKPHYYPIDDVVVRRGAPGG